MERRLGRNDAQIVNDYYVQRMKALINILRDDEREGDGGMIHRSYIIEKLNAIKNGAFNIHPKFKYEYTGKDKSGKPVRDADNEWWVRDKEFNQIKDKIKLMEEL